MDRVSDRHRHMIIGMATAFVCLSHAFRELARCIHDSQGLMGLLELIEPYEEQPIVTKPLPLPSSFPALPMKHQVLNRKPLRATARSSC